MRCEKAPSEAEGDFLENRDEVEVLRPLRATSASVQRVLSDELQGRTG